MIASTLEIWTARISTRDPDRFDITRKSGGPAGEPFAPSWKILRPALDARKQGVEDHDKAWAVYVPAYYAEMRVSYKTQRSTWESLLLRPRVVLCCYCTDSTHCHRTLLANILSKFGATTKGELVKRMVPP